MKNAHIYHICTGHRSSWTCANRFGSDVGQDTMFIIHAQRVCQTKYAQAVLSAATWRFVDYLITTLLCYNITALCCLLRPVICSICSWFHELVLSTYLSASWRLRHCGCCGSFRYHASFCRRWKAPDQTLPWYIVLGLGTPYMYASLAVMNTILQIHMCLICKPCWLLDERIT